jgi:hypothetical protein
MTHVHAAAEKNTRNVAASNLFMRVISFPKNEWENIKSRLDSGKIVYTIRVDGE